MNPKPAGFDFELASRLKEFDWLVRRSPQAEGRRAGVFATAPVTSAGTEGVCQFAAGGISTLSAISS
jgi:hypothetical protein